MLIKIVKRCAYYLIRRLGFLPFVSLIREGSSLVDDGWFRSFKEGASVDKDGNPIPWMTYSSIDFIKPRLKETFDLFEYGCGNSTLFYAGLVNTVTSVEHTESWAMLVKEKAPQNVTLLIQTLEYGEDYCKSCIRQGAKYDIVVIDGRDRVNCVKQVVSSKALKEEGVIIFDNTDRSCYDEAYSFLLTSGFNRIDFFGIGPIVQIKTCTSIFYKHDNVLGI